MFFQMYVFIKSSNRELSYTLVAINIKFLASKNLYSNDLCYLFCKIDDKKVISLQNFI